jgi:hypothetical protein
MGIFGNSPLQGEHAKKAHLEKKAHSKKAWHGFLRPMPGFSTYIPSF